MVKKLLYYGIGAIPLSAAGSSYTNGIRICVSLVADNSIDLLENRLQSFSKNHIKISN